MKTYRNDKFVKTSKKVRITFGGLGRQELQR